MPFLLGPGSQCDVCLDCFDGEEHAPSSIECGHVFCLQCLKQLTRSKCPLCRQRFDPRSVVKLHINLDEARSPSHSPNPPTESDDVLQARKYQERIAAAANEGTTEQGVRQLIDECRTFLSQQPRPNFSDLRVSLRMIKYVYDIKTELLSHRQEIKRISNESKEEKVALQEMIKTLEDDMKRDRENWQALESNLRDYCSKAQGAYFGVAELYLKAETERTLLRDTLRQLGYNAPYILPVDAPRATDSDSSVPDTPFPLKSDMFSPIPDLADAELPGTSTVSLANIALRPEGEGPEKSIGTIPPLARCGMVGCPFSCRCQSIGLFDDPSQLLSSVTQVASHATGGYFSHTPSIAQTLHAHADLFSEGPVQPGPASSVPPIPVPAPASSGRSALSLTAPSNREREHYGSSSISSSRVPTRPATPVEGEAADWTPVTTPRIPIPPGRMPSYPVVNRRHDLSAETAPSSASLPNIPVSGTHFPASRYPTEDASTKSRSGSPYRSLRVSPPLMDGENRLSSGSGGSQPRTSATSSASDAAKALEKQYKERERQYKLEKEKEYKPETQKTVDGHGASEGSSRGRRTKDRGSPKSVESAAIGDSSRARSRSVRRERDRERDQVVEGLSSTRSSRTKTSSTSAAMYASPTVPGLTRTPTNIYAAAAPVTNTTPTWTYAQSQSQHMGYHSSKAKVMTSSTIKPATATLAGL